jgi:hypothetical protein
LKVSAFYADDNIEEIMEIVGNRKFVELPGEKTHELPPLLVMVAHQRRLDRVMNMASELVESDALIPDIATDSQRMDLAIQLVEQYLSLQAQWKWGDSVLEWIRQCETTFENVTELRPLLRPDVWPHAGRTSFIDLLRDKKVPHEGVELERAVGLRLTFRHLPPLSCCTDQFLFYLNSPVASSAYQTWAQLTPNPVSSLPPERFHFDVVSWQ